MTCRKLGLNPWKSKYRLWCEKTGKISDEVPDNDAMMTGRDLEQYVAERFERETGKKVRRDNYKYTLEEYPFMVGHIDRSVIGENAILECKTANSEGDLPGSLLRPVSALHGCYRM